MLIASVIRIRGSCGRSITGHRPWRSSHPCRRRCSSTCDATCRTWRRLTDAETRRASRCLP